MQCGCQGAAAPLDHVDGRPAATRPAGRCGADCDSLGPASVDRAPARMRAPRMDSLALLQGAGTGGPGGAARCRREATLRRGGRHHMGLECPGRVSGRLVAVSEGDDDESRCRLKFGCLRTATAGHRAPRPSDASRRCAHRDDPPTMESGLKVRRTVMRRALARPLPLWRLDRSAYRGVALEVDDARPCPPCAVPTGRALLNAGSEALAAVRPRAARDAAASARPVQGVRVRADVRRARRAGDHGTCGRQARRHRAVRPAVAVDRAGDHRNPFRASRPRRLPAASRDAARVAGAPARLCRGARDRSSPSRRVAPGAHRRPAHPAPPRCAPGPSAAPRAAARGAIADVSRDR